MKFKNIISFATFYILSLSMAFAQGGDIFGISEKARTPKSESALGNVFRNGVSHISLEFSTGPAFHQSKMGFLSQEPSVFPFYQYQNFENSLDLIDGVPYKMESEDWALPMNIGLRINIFNLITIGGGFGREWGNISNLRGGDFEYNFEGASYQVSKLYGTVGLVLYDANKRKNFLKWRYRKYSTNNRYMQSELRQRARQIYPWRFILEGEFGQLTLNKSFDPNVTISEDPYYGIGLRVERDFSEYTKMFVKGGAEFRVFQYSLPGLADIQDIDQSVYALQVGLAIRLPGTKRCKIAGCGVVMKHMHNGIEYRGSGIFSYQNRKVGQWY